MFKISWKPKEYQPAELPPVSEGPLEGCTFILDCVECEIAKPVDPEAAEHYHSGKAHTSTIKYEVAVSVSTGRVMWISGGDGGRNNDQYVLKQNGLLEFIPEDEVGIADKGYINRKHSDRLLWPLTKRRVDGIPCLEWGESLYNYYVCSLRIEVERVFGRMKKCFMFLRYSNGRDHAYHRVFFHIIAHTHNITLEFQPMRRQLHHNLTNPPTELPIPARAAKGLKRRRQ